MSDPLRDLGAVLKGAVIMEGLSCLSRRAGVHKNWLFRASVPENPRYSDVIPSPLIRLMKALELTIRPVAEPETPAGCFTELLLRIDTLLEVPEWKKKILCNMAMTIIELTEER